jgi:hypothetical protein
MDLPFVSGEVEELSPPIFLNENLLILFYRLILRAAAKCVKQLEIPGIEHREILVFN